MCVLYMHGKCAWWCASECIYVSVWCMYMCVHMYVCAHAYVWCIYGYMCAMVHNVCAYVYVCICTCVCSYVYVFTGECACMYCVLRKVFKYYACLHIIVHDTHTHTHSVCAYAYTWMCVCVLVHEVPGSDCVIINFNRKSTW